MKPGHGEVLIAEGDPEVSEEERELIDAFRAQLDAGLWAAVPLTGPAGRRQAQMVKSFDEVPRDADRVIFFPAQPAAADLRTSAMLLALSATLIVILVLLWEVMLPRIEEALERRKARRARVPGFDHDPGRERRAEQRARALLKSCVNEEEWAMYRDLGLIRVWGKGGEGVEYAYLVYPHKPIVAYLPQTGVLLNEYCVEFPDETRPVRQLAAAGLRRRARQVDGADRRRAPRHRVGEHAPARPPGRSQAGAPRPLAPEPVGAPAPRRRAPPLRRIRLTPDAFRRRSRGSGDSYRPSGPCAGHRTHDLAGGRCVRRGMDSVRLRSWTRSIVLAP
jgi:hypothetical protein